MASLPSLLHASPALIDDQTTSVSDTVGRITTPDLSVLLLQIFPFAYPSSEPPLSYAAVHNLPRQLFFISNLYICPECNRLYPNHKVIVSHSKRDHHSDDVSDAITWNQ